MAFAQCAHCSFGYSSFTTQSDWLVINLGKRVPDHDDARTSELITDMRVRH